MTVTCARSRHCRGALAAILWVAAFFAWGNPAACEEYLGRDDFLALAFPGDTPELQTMWITPDTRAAAEDELGWSPRALRMRYWEAGSRTAWILEEIGKEKPITLGVVVNAARIERVDVLAFRESRGWEIRYPFFTAQFDGLELEDNGYLSGHIDGITGATLSVRAVEKVARRALWLDSQVRPQVSARVGG